jgi:hypothetical protein
MFVAHLLSRNIKIEEVRIPVEVGH